MATVNIGKVDVAFGTAAELSKEAAIGRATVGGTANAITLSLPGVDLFEGMQVRFRATATNTGSVTINYNGTGAVAAQTIRNAALPAGYISTTQDTVAVRVGSVWQVRPAVSSSVTDENLRQMLRGDFGVGGFCLYRTDFRGNNLNLFGRADAATLNKPPAGNDFNFLNMASSANSNTVLAMQWSSTNPRAWIFSQAVDYSPWRELYHTGNTTVDGNGFIKQASPILRLFANHLEEHMQPQGAVLEKVGTGHYRITGTLGFATEGWWIETPKDANGMIKFLTEYEQELDGTIVIRTYEPTGTGWKPEKGEPVDITEGRWIDIRLEPYPVPEIEEEPETDQPVTEGDI